MCPTAMHGERYVLFFFFFQAEDGIRDVAVTGVQTCALPIFRGDAHDVSPPARAASRRRGDRRGDRLRARHAVGRRDPRARDGRDRAGPARGPRRDRSRRRLAPPAKRPPEIDGLRDVRPGRDGRLGPRATGRRVRASHDRRRERAPGAGPRADSGMVRAAGRRGAAVRAGARPGAGAPACEASKTEIAPPAEARSLTMVDLDGGPLALEAVEAVARRGEPVALAPSAERALRAGRVFVDRLAAGA